MKIAELRNMVNQAKQRQMAGQANENIREHVGEQLLVVGMHITRGIKIDTLTLDKVTYSLKDGKALDGFHLAATESAKELIEVLGEGPYQAPLIMEICEQETKRGTVYYAQLLGMVEDAFAELEEEIAADQPQSEEAE